MNNELPYTVQMYDDKNEVIISYGSSNTLEAAKSVALALSRTNGGCATSVFQEDKQIAAFFCGEDHSSIIS